MVEEFSSSNSYSTEGTQLLLLNCVTDAGVVNPCLAGMPWPCRFTPRAYEIAQAKVEMGRKGQRLKAMHRSKVQRLNDQP